MTVPINHFLGRLPLIQVSGSALKFGNFFIRNLIWAWERILSVGFGFLSQIKCVGDGFLESRLTLQLSNLELILCSMQQISRYFCLQHRILAEDSGLRPILLECYRYGQSYRISSWYDGY